MRQLFILFALDQKHISIVVTLNGLTKTHTILLTQTISIF